MNTIFKICSNIRPLTVSINSFMAGLFYCEKMYWIAAVLALIVIINLFYLQSKQNSNESKGNNS